MDKAIVRQFDKGGPKRHNSPMAQTAAQRPDWPPPPTYSAPELMPFPGERVLRLPPPTIRDVAHDPVLSQTLLSAIGYFPDAVGHYCQRPHGAAMAVLIYAVRGRGWGEFLGRRFPVEPGHILLLPYHVPHGYGAAAKDPWTIYWMHLEGRLLRRLTDDIVAAGGGPLLPLGEAPSLLNLFDQAFAYLAESYRRLNLVAASLCAANFLGAVQCLQRAAQFRTEQAADRIEHALTLLHGRVRGQVTVAELAAAANLSESRFALLFKKRTGSTVKNYFLGLKIRCACHLLDTTTQSIKTIAEQLGFHDQLYFSRQFRKIQGHSPTDYRATKRG